MKAVVLLSGGLDSATVLAIAKSQGFDVTCMSFRYGQRHVVELESAKKVAAAMLAPLRVVDVDLRAFGGSALTDDIAVPKGGVEGGVIPVTYVPARNTIFLSFALGLAEVIGACDLFIGANAVDYSGYPDCRPAFLEQFERLCQLATKAGVEGAKFTVHAPLVAMTKAEIIRTGVGLGVDYGLTWSCYDPQLFWGTPPDPQGGARACGACDSCRIRRQGFVDAGVKDPTPYAG